MDAPRSRGMSLVRRSAILAAGFSALNALVSAAFGPVDLATSLLLVLVGFPLSFALFYGLGRITSRHWTQRLARSAAALGLRTDPSAFTWKGRRWRMALGFLVFGALMASPFFLPGPAFAENPTVQTTLEVLAVVFLGMVAFATANALREKTLLIDDSGVHFHGRLWGNFDVRWPEMGLIGLVSATPVEGLMLTPQASPRFIVFRSTDGRTAGLLNPRLEIDPDLEVALGETIRTQADRHGIPMREVPWREYMRWKRRPSRPA